MVDLPAPRQAGEPQHRRLLALQPGVGFAADVERLPMDVLRPPKGEVQHARGDGGVGELVDQDEAAQRAGWAEPPCSVAIGLEHDRPVGGDFGDADRVQVERLRRQLFERVDVELMLGLGDGRGGGLGAELQPIAAAGDHRLVGHPDDGRFELVGGVRRVLGRGDDVAARAVDLLGRASA